MKFVLTSLLLALSAASASAEQAPARTSEVLPGVDLPAHIAETISPEQLKKAQEIGSTVVKDILDAYRTKATESDRQIAQDARRRADSIADEALQAERDAVLEFLGLDPASETGLYVFVSWSMPLETLRSYAIEAMWSGATLVFKGIPEGEEPAQFITQKLRHLVYGKGASANISIDPRLFDAYQVSAVPTLVFTTVQQDLQCQGVERVEMSFPNGVKSHYDKCPALPDDSYWKMSGAVTTNYALQTFVDDGAKGAAPYLRALARGFAEGKTPGREQRGFAGEWKDVLSPSEQMAAQEAYRALIPTAPTQ